jgi:hypothetical protein
VLRLKLRPGAYEWRFVGSDGSVLDRGARSYADGETSIGRRARRRCDDAGVLTPGMLSKTFARRPIPNSPAWRSRASATAVARGARRQKSPRRLGSWASRGRGRYLVAHPDESRRSPTSRRAGGALRELAGDIDRLGSPPASGGSGGAMFG